jgi:hypothetical protein
MKYNAFGANEGSGRHGAGGSDRDCSTTPRTVIVDSPDRVSAVDFQVDTTIDRGADHKIVSIVDEHHL